jgi:hypothetical protein
MIPWTALFAATAWVDLVGVVLTKLGLLGKSIAVWYSEFGLSSVGADILSIMLVVSLGMFLVPGASGLSLVAVVIGLQMIHDILFYGVILAVPAGQNRIMDLFKRYSAEGSWRILLADAIMVSSSVYLMETMDAYLTDDQVLWAGLLGIYSLVYLLFTH